MCDTVRDGEDIFSSVIQANFFKIESICVISRAFHSCMCTGGYLIYHQSQSYVYSKTALNTLKSSETNGPGSKVKSGKRYTFISIIKCKEYFKVLFYVKARTKKVTSPTGRYMIRLSKNYKSKPLELTLLFTHSVHWNT